MSIPNPFSSSNVLEHIIAPKIVGSQSGYRVAVDLVDVDTVYARQLGSTALPVSIEYLTQLGTESEPVAQGYLNEIGSTGRPVTQAYFDQIGSSALPVGDLYAQNIYWSNFVPTLPGGGGGTASFLGGTGIDLSTSGFVTTITSLISGSSGIGVTTMPVGDSTGYVLSNLTSVTGGIGVGVVQTGNTFLVSSKLAFVPTTPNVSINNVGNTFFFGVSSSTGSTFTGITGPTGQIVYTTPSGTTSTPNIVYDGTTFQVPSTRLSTPGQGGVLDISTYETDVYIESGFADITGAGNYITFSALRGNIPAMSIDTINNRVGVLTDLPSTTLDVKGQTEITFNASNGAIQTLVLKASGVTGSYVVTPGRYIFDGWGAGGNSSGGTGGAGGYASAQVTFGQTGTVSWNGSYGGASGGGNALVASFNGTPFLYVPGGGGGVTGGEGAAAQEAQGLPTPMGGLSSTTIGQTAFAFYNDPQNYLYSIVTPTSVTGGTFRNGNIGGLTSSGPSGTNITFFPPANQTNPGSSIVYTVEPGTRIAINPVNLLFSGSTFSSPDSTIIVPDIPPSGLDAGRPTTGVTGNDYALYDFWPGNTFPDIQGNPPVSVPVGSFFPVGAGNVRWQSGELIFFAETTLSFSFTGPINDPSSGNSNLTFAGPVTMVTSEPLPFIMNAIISTDGQVTLPRNASIGVSYRRFVNYGVSASGNTGIGAGGGGLLGGGAAALVTSVAGIVDVIPGTTGNRPAGGGAGSWGFINVAGLTFSDGEIKIGGRGTAPYLSPFNPIGRFGFGGTTGSGGSQFLVLQQEPDNPATLPALIVNGDANVSGIIRCNSNVQTSTIFLPDNTGTTFFQINADRDNLRIKNSIQTNNAGGDNFVLSSNGNIGLGDGTLGLNPSTYNVNIGPKGSTAVNLSVSGNSTLNGLTASSLNVSGNSVLAAVQSSGLNVNGTSVFNGGIQIQGTNTLSIGPNAYFSNQGIPNILANVGSIAALSIGASSINFNPGSANGGIYAYNFDTFTAQDFIARSDSRIKDNVVTIDSALDKVMRMRGVYYDDKDGVHNVGVIAQEVEAVLPEVVHTDENDMKSVSYGRIVGLLIEAIKEQQEIIKDLISK